LLYVLLKGFFKMHFKISFHQFIHCAKCSFAALVISVALPANPAVADVGYGGGLNYVFGQGLSVGLRVFSDDEEDEVAGSMGIDYVLKGRSWRPVVGLVYLGDDHYGELNFGYNLTSKTFDVGVGVGYADTEDDKNNKCDPTEIVPYRGQDFTQFAGACDGGGSGNGDLFGIIGEGSYGGDSPP
jgi:hypothetical protein